ncbi:MAG: hypothetical protein HZA04_05220 [Nitrospinae bacterium]|nr:hypothetical protein [Nitrospinota bacterium]
MGTFGKTSVIALAVIALLSLPAEAAKKTKRAPKAKKPAVVKTVKKEPRTIGGFQNASECAKCHVDIYRNWQNSLHALSYKNPIFQTAYMRAYTQTKGEAAKYCLDCHAPTVAATKDFDAKADITKEGVTCDFCHSVTKVTVGADSPFELQPGNIKRGALNAPRAEEHGVEYSKDFASSRLCAGCHDFTNRNGVHVGNTYQEWRSSSFAQDGTECQNCHMPEVPGTTADKGGRDKMHDHSLSHNTESMKDAVSVETKGVNRMNDELLVDVMVHNWKAGHAIPTGTPARTLVLEVRTLDGSKRIIETKKTVYRKTVVDGSAREVTSDADAFLYGTKISKDNRLAPDETRLETFRFATRIRDVATVEAITYFLHQPLVIQQTEMTIPLSSSSLPVK